MIYEHRFTMHDGKRYCRICRISVLEARYVTCQT